MLTQTFQGVRLNWDINQIATLLLEEYSTNFRASPWEREMQEVSLKFLY